jgi:hypothetical protein
LSGPSGVGTRCKVHFRIARPSTVGYGFGTTRVTLTQFSVPSIPNTLLAREACDGQCR